MGAVAKSSMRKGFLIDKKLCKYLVKYKETVSHTVYDFATAPLLDFLIYEENFVFFFISVHIHYMYCIMR
jgi:hypothetical protein